MLKLYGTNSPNVRKVMILLEEIGLPYDLQFVDVLRGEQFQPEFQALNPLGRVPVLVDTGEADAEPMFESGAILIYLAETHARDDLLPASGAERYAVLKWLMFQMGSVGPMFGQHNHFIITPDEAESYAGRRYREQAWRIYQQLEARLTRTPWLAGQSYSIADIATYPWALYVEKHGFDWSDLPRLGEWRDRIAARPAAARAAARINAPGLTSPRAATPPSQEDLDRFFWRESGGPATDLSPMRRGSFG